MFAASAYKLLKGVQETPGLFNEDNLGILLLGNVVAFVVAMAAIRFFIAFLTRHGFRWFGWYRIVLGTVLLILLAMGTDLSVV